MSEVGSVLPVGPRTPQGGGRAQNWHHMLDKRLIEAAFPLKQVSMDAVHEKNVRHGHVSTLHIWPARRPLAASRAALIATLLGDPGDAKGRQAILERLAGRVVERVKRHRVNGRLEEQVKEETAGGILHWGRESDEDLQWFRDEIRKAFRGRAPRVLDPFAGGGAIPLEGMRLGCDVTAVDINPVAWFILKCTLEYPQRLAARTQPLPEFATRDAQFMAAFLKARGFKGSVLRTLLQRLGHGDRVEMQLDLISRDDPLLDADLAWHVRAWGRWVLGRARKELARHYPTYAEFVPLTLGSEYEARSLRLLGTDDAGEPLLDPLNAEFDSPYLGDPRNPRWVAKPTVVYLHARTVTCKQCRVVLPLLKTRWLCKKDRKRVLLTMEPDTSQAGVVFGVRADVPQTGGNTAQRREHDKRIGGGTMSRTGATCPCCRAIMTMEDIRLEGRAGRLGTVMTAVVVDGPRGKEYRLPTEHEREAAEVTEEQLQAIFADIPFGLPDEPTPKAGSGASRAFSVDGYGFDRWRELFTNRQLLALGAFIRALRSMPKQHRLSARMEGVDRRDVCAHHQPHGRPREHAGNVDQQSRTDQEHIRSIRLAHHLGLLRVRATLGHHGRLRAIRRLGVQGLRPSPEQRRHSSQRNHPAGIRNRLPDCRCRSGRDRPSLLRRDSVLRPDGLLPRLAETFGVRLVS